MLELSQYYAQVEEVISSLGIDPVVTRGPHAGNWVLVRGSAKVYVDVWYIEAQQQAYFQVMSPVMRLPAPEHHHAFFRELLEINDLLFGVAFTVFNGWAWLKHIREVVGLDKSEVAAMMQRVGTYADDYDDKLIAKYTSGPAAPSGPSDAGAPAPPGAS